MVIFYIYIIIYSAKFCEGEVLKFSHYFKGWIDKVQFCFTATRFYSYYFSVYFAGFVGFFLFFFFSFPKQVAAKKVTAI